MAKKVKCIFCDLKSTKSKEHVWPKWVQKHFKMEENVYRLQHKSIVGIPKSTRELKSLAMVLGKTCEKCNNGWMSKLEVDVKPILLKFLKVGLLESVFMSENEKQILSKWIFKTAIVYNRSSNYTNIVPSSHFRHLYNYSSIPNNVFVDVALTKTSKLFSAIQSQSMIGTLNGMDSTEVLPYLNKFYNIIIQISHCLFRIAYIPLQNHEIVNNNTANSVYRINQEGNSSFQFKSSFNDIIDFETSTFYQ